MNRRDFCLSLSQSALALALMGRASQLLAAKPNSQKAGSALVLGAGLSGLYSACLLEKQGFKVTVIEARVPKASVAYRVGGRVLTLDNVPGKPESGGQNFSAQYQRLSKLVASLDIPTKLRKSPASNSYFRSNAN